MTRYAKYTVLDCICKVSVLTVIATGCFDADPRTVRGALDAAARALEADDGQALFRVLDERSRNAMHTIVKQRRAAAELVRRDYPEGERSAALAALGDAATVTDASALFAARCQRECRADIVRRLGAPERETPDGDDVVVTTVDGQTIRLHRGRDTWFGIVWHLDELDRERTRAVRELKQIEDNAAVYRKRRELEEASPSAPDPG